MHDHPYGHVPTYSAYTANVHRYDQPISRPHTSSHDRRDDYDLAPLAWPHAPAQNPGRNPPGAPYEHPSDSEMPQLCVSRPTVISPQPTTPNGPFQVNCR